MKSYEEVKKYYQQRRAELIKQINSRLKVCGSFTKIFELVAEKEDRNPKKKFKLRRPLKPQSYIEYTSSSNLRVRTYANACSIAYSNFYRLTTEKNELESAFKYYSRFFKNQGCELVLLSEKDSKNSEKRYNCCLS